MLWSWLGFIAGVAVLLALVRGSPAPRRSVVWGIGCGAVGLLFAIVVYITHEHGPGDSDAGIDAAAMYLAAYVLECALSFDAALAIWAVLAMHRVPASAQPRLLWWALVATIGLRALVLVGGAYLAAAFDGVLYLVGGFLVYQALASIPDPDDSDSSSSRLLQRAAPTCLLIMIVELSLARDSLAVLAISQNVFVIVTSNIMATMTTRSLYGLLVSGDANVLLRHLRPATTALFLLTGATLLLRTYVDVPPLGMLALVVLVLGAAASVHAVRTR